MNTYYIYNNLNPSENYTVSASDELEMFENFLRLKNLSNSHALQFLLTFFKENYSWRCNA